MLLIGFWSHQWHYANQRNTLTLLLDSALVFAIVGFLNILIGGILVIIHIEKTKGLFKHTLEKQKKDFQDFLKTVSSETDKDRQKKK